MSQDKNSEMSNLWSTYTRAGALKGVELLRDPFRNRGLDFTDMQRRDNGLKGLLPNTLDSGYQFQMGVCMARLESLQSALDKYDYLLRIFDEDRRLFFTLMNRNCELIMPLVYTPTVGAACQQYSLVHHNARGLFIPMSEGGVIRDILHNWPYAKDVKAICVTDGERILGLGDLGCFGMGIPVGKLALCTGLAGIPNNHLLPIVLDVGTNNKSLLNSPTYFGTKSERTTGLGYDNFISEFMEACVDVFGKDVLIQFEDFGNHNAFRFLRQYRDKYCTFNDDIQGTASVILSGLMTACRITNRKLKDETIVCYGAGESMIGFAGLFTECLKKNCGLSEEEAKAHIWMVDSRGLIVEGRSTGGISAEKAPFARKAGSTPEIKDLVEVINKAKATALIGASANPGAFNDAVLKAMANQCPQPIIFSLSNPTHKSECTAEQAYKATKGKCIFASGSPFPKLKLDPSEVEPADSNLTRRPGQANNAFIFPGLVLAISTFKISPIVDEDFIVAAESLAQNVRDEDLCEGCIFPRWEYIRNVSCSIARRVALNAAKQGRVHLNRCADGKTATTKQLSDADIIKEIQSMSSYPEPLAQNDWAK